MVLSFIAAILVEDTGEQGENHWIYIMLNIYYDTVI
jgi:hypothetical protein